MPKKLNARLAEAFAFLINNDLACACLVHVMEEFQAVNAAVGAITGLVCGSGLGA